MRSVLLAFMLCVTSTAALARNGETGILIALPEFRMEQFQDKGIVKVCDREWETIHEVLAAGYQTHVVLGDLGKYEALQEQDGAVRLVNPDGDEKVLAPQDCVPSADGESEVACD